MFSAEEKKSHDEHFKFGENWDAYSKTIGAADIKEAEVGLLRLLPAEEWRGKTIVDIGCGSGIHSLSMYRLGAANVHCVDIDPSSVNTTKSVLESFDIHTKTEVENILSPEHLDEYYDIVYSWGVLHHTGDMDLAIRNAAKHVAEGGYFIIALYRKTKTCDTWVPIKRWFTKRSKVTQTLVVWIYLFLRAINRIFKLKNPFTVFGAHKNKRGMKEYYDAFDWLGGYPYESSRPEETVAFVEGLGFETLLQPKKKKEKTGLFGSTCVEYVFRKVS